jgi:hypothetical protein
LETANAEKQNVSLGRGSIIRPIEATCGRGKRPLWESGSLDVAASCSGSELTERVVYEYVVEKHD